MYGIMLYGIVVRYCVVWYGIVLLYGTVLCGIVLCHANQELKSKSALCQASLQNNDYVGQPLKP